MRSVIIVLLLAIVFVSSACDTGSTTPTTTPSALTSEQKGQQISAIFSLPFQAVLPTYLPDGMEFVGVFVNRDSITVKDALGNVMEWGNAESRDRTTMAELRFANADETEGLVLYESIVMAETGDAGAVKVMIGGVEGKMVEQEDRQLLSLDWPGDGMGYSLIAFMRGSLTKEEVIRVAESLPTKAK